MARTVVGVFDTGAAAKRAIEALVEAGIPRSDISLVAGDPQGEYAAYGEGGTRAEGSTPGEGAAAGAAGGAVLGGVLGLLAGIAALPIPGIGPIIAAGPIAAALGGTAVGAGLGAATGGLIGYLTNLGVPESEAGYYSEAVRRGSTLVTVQASEPEAERIASILDRSGARDIEGMAAEWRREGWAGPTAEAETARAGWAGRATGTEARPEGWTGAPIGTESAREAWAGAAAGADAPREGWTGVEAGAGARAADEERRAIPVVREELQVGKRAVQHGGVRVYSRVTEEPAEEQVRLREERVQVERRPADRAVRPEDTAAFQETSFEMTETAEEPVVAKQARVIEEVVIGKDVQERTETVRDRVRRTSVDVERTGDVERAGRAAGGGTPRYEAWESDFRQHCDTAFAGSGWSYEDCAPAYRYGHTIASDPGFAGRDWPAIEADARQRWEERNPGTWDRFEDSIRYAWDRVRGQARAA